MADEETKPIPDEDDELKVLLGKPPGSLPLITYKDWLKTARREIRSREAGARLLGPARYAAIHLKLEIEYGIKCDCCSRLLPEPDPNFYRGHAEPHPRRCRACQDVEGPIP